MRSQIQWLSFYRWENWLEGIKGHVAVCGSGTSACTSWPQSVLVASHHEAARLVLGADLGLELKTDLSRSFYGGQGKSWIKATWSLLSYMEKSLLRWVFPCWHLPLAGSFHLSTLVLEKNVFRKLLVAFCAFTLLLLYYHRQGSYDRKWLITLSRIFWSQVCMPFLRFLSVDVYWVNRDSLVMTGIACLSVGFSAHPPEGLILFLGKRRWAVIR